MRIILCFWSELSLRASRVVKADFSPDQAGLARLAPGKAAVRKFTMKTPTENQDIIRPPPTETQMDPAVIPRKESTITSQLNPNRGGFNKIPL